MVNLDARRKIEIEFWRDNHAERPEVDDIENQLDKSADAFIFREAIRPFEAILSDARGRPGAWRWARMGVVRAEAALSPFTSDHFRYQ